MVSSNPTQIVVLTYDRPHRRTQDLCFALKAWGHPVTLMTVPWVDMGTPFKELFEWRPSVPLQISPWDFARNLGFGYVQLESYMDLIPKYHGEVVLIGGAQVIPKDVVDQVPIINSHPGLLPHNRGLDTVKWAILNGDPIGVTTYYIGEECDTGDLINQQMTPLHINDTLMSIGYRTYGLEISLHVESIGLAKSGKKLTPKYAIQKRVPHYLELRLPKMVERYLEDRCL